MAFCGKRPFERTPKSRRGCRLSPGGQWGGPGMADYAASQCTENVHHLAPWWWEATGVDEEEAEDDGLVDDCLPQIASCSRR